MKFTRRQFLGFASAFGLASCAKAKRAVPDLNLTRFVPSFGGDEFTFATLNDLHVLDAKSVGIVNQAVNSINADRRVQFTIVLGDMATDGRYEQLKLAKVALDRLEKPCFAVPGNHDVDMKAKDIFSSYTSTYGPAHWDQGKEGWMFIGLNSCVGSESDVTIPQEELDWLEKTLKKVNRSRPIALFAHHPFNPNTKAYRVLNADDVLGLFAEHRLKLVAAGHFHGNQVEEQDGVLFTTTACCSSTRNNFDKTTEKGYRLYHVTKESLETEFVVVRS
ncbi:MAG TPA: metallophosphoesterase [Candidatus Hydrogenedentes bacterium]|nr:metallophosphoesterase [Candidatus Hydrogenedentota bacterium]HPJ98848.1 metallophosphoesterase [Candidatus Hydrogenedentota bacterium]